jgi:hypothetical protein
MFADWENVITIFVGISRNGRLDESSGIELYHVRLNPIYNFRSTKRCNLA